MTKKELVAKIAKEQGLDPKKLDRRNMEQLKKMDAVVADEGDLLGGPSEIAHAGLPMGLPIEEGTQVVGEVGGMQPSITETPKSPDTVETQEGSDTLRSGADAVVKEHIIIGYHPVTEAPVYADEQ